MTEELGLGSPFLDPSHPLLKRIQDALSKQLGAAKQKLILELREKEEALKKGLQSKEEVGAQLYNLQQELGKIQEAVSKAHISYEEAKNGREKSEVVVAEVKSEYQKQSDELAQQRVKVAELQKEYDRLNGFVQTLEANHSELVSRLAVQKRETFKAEEDATNLEKTKLEQDLIINKLNEQVKVLEDRLIYLEAQLQAQRRETGAAAETLAEAAREMENITYEKKQLLQKWKSSLTAISRRDEALHATEGETKKQKEELLALDGEINNYKKAIQAEQIKNENLTGILNKVNTEINFLEKQIQKWKERKEKLIAEYNDYQKTLEQTEEELGKVMQERRGLEEHVNTLQKEGDAIVNETVKLEEQIAQNLQIQKTLEKGAANTEQGAQKITGGVREKEMQIAQLQNESARIRVDSQNANSHNIKLKAALDQMVASLKEKDKLVERYEVEIRRRNDEIERKQSEVDRLNKKYDLLVSNMKDENMGPLEATIHNLTNEITNKIKECSDLQYYWLRSQTELVKLNKEMERETEELQDMERQFTILTQKQMRIGGSFDSHEHDIKEMEANIKSLQSDMQKLNSLVVKNSKLQTLLEEGNFDLENEFHSQLKDAEREAIHLENKIIAVKEEKTNIIHDIVEAERLKMLWEKKIELAKETKAALDPNIGAVEQKALQKEIQRMKTTHAQLRKNIEILILELERAVGRRESVIVRGSKAIAKNAVTAKNIVQKKTNDLSKKVKQTKQEIVELNRAASNLAQRKEYLQVEIQELQEEAQKKRELESTITRELENGIVSKQRCFELITLYQKLGKKYASAATEDFDSRETMVAREYAKQVEKSAKVAEIYATLESAYPHLKETLNTFRNDVRAQS